MMEPCEKISGNIVNRTMIFVTSFISVDIYFTKLFMRYLKTSGCIIYLLILLIACNNNNSAKVENEINIQPARDSLPDFKIVLFKNDTVKSEPHLSGFGYTIFQNNKPFIHQPNIPAVAGNAGFSNAEDAQKTAALMVYKLQHHIVPPAISVEELDSLRIRIGQ